MAWHGGQRKRKKTGGKKRDHRSKRLHELGSSPVETSLDETKRKIVTGRARLEKVKLISDRYVNVSDPSTGQTDRLEILDVVENPSNVDYNRRGVITKGTIIRTESGLARIVSRPGQDGVLNAILYEDE